MTTIVLSRRNHRGFYFLLLLLPLAILLIFALSPAAAEDRPLCAPIGADDDANDTVAIQAAIDQCATMGGKVILGPGLWRTGGLILRSEMEFHLAAGAVLQLIPDIALYPALEGPGEAAGNQRFIVGLHAPFVERLIISGPGKIDGQGPQFWDKDFYKLGLPRPTLPRPEPLLELADCKNVVVRDLTMIDLPAYAIRLHRCDGARVENVTIRNDPRSPNTDGVQIRDSSNVTITGADIATGDDAIVLKSRARAVENIVVENSILESDDAALKFGTGSAIGVRNSVFRDLTIRNSRYGIAIFQIDGGTHADNRFERISIHTGGRHKRTFPIFVDIDRRDADRNWGKIERHVFDSISIDTSGAILIAGNPAAPIRDLVLSRLSMTMRAPMVDVTQTPGKPRGNVQIKAQAGSVDLGQENAHVVLGHIDGLNLRDIAIDDDSRGREGLRLIKVTQAAGKNGR